MRLTYCACSALYVLADVVYRVVIIVVKEVQAVEPRTSFDRVRREVAEISWMSHDEDCGSKECGFF